MYSGFLFCCCDYNSGHKQLREKCLFDLHSQVTVHYWGGGCQRESVSRNHARKLIWGLLSLMLSWLSDTAQNHLPRDDTAHGGLGFPASMNN